MRKWQPIKTAPKDGTYLVVWDGKNQRPVVPELRGSDGTFWMGDWDWIVDATHWMPLPPPPKGEQP